jgi:hypothetical protein
MNPSYKWGLTMKQRYAYHKPFTVKFSDKCEWQNKFQPDIKGAWSDKWMGPRPIKALVQESTDGVQKGGITSALGSKPQYSRLKYGL